ncbi:MAG: Nramp family divalent metal transporter [Anaerolineaceae bacterium]|nr:Nramp family divalent metal transporter [Anaerolineaceae bacterium]
MQSAITTSLWKKLKPYRVRILLLLAVVGPGIITANVDNDAGGITTYSVAGAHYGYTLLWMLPLVALALIIVQEMSARLGVITGKGLADLIREMMGVKVTAVILGLLVFVNLANTVSEFAGVAASMEVFNISKFISVPLAAVGVWFLIVKGNYKMVERVFLVASAIYLAYVASGIMAKPDWGQVLVASRTPVFHLDVGFVTIFVTIIGTTIAPWMQFYQQSSIVDKGIRSEDYKYEVADVLVGSLFAVFVAAFIVIACASTMFTHGIQIQDAKDAAVALGPLAGKYAGTLFAIGLLNASLFSAGILPLSTAYTVSEAFGFESGVSRSFKEAPVFFGIYTALIVVGALIILLPIKSLVQTMIVSQTMNGVLLPVILIVMLRLINNKRIMGKFTNGRVYNLLSWVTAVILIVLAIILVIVTFFPNAATLLTSISRLI